MSALAVLDLFGMVTIVYGFSLFAAITLKFKWIVERFEANPEVLDSPLFFPYRISFMKTFAYVCNLASLDLIQDWMVEYGIRKGHVPAHTSRAAVLQYFTEEERHKVRRAKWAIAIFLGALLVLVVSEWFIPGVKTEP
jgi:hypothetical protein